MTDASVLNALVSFPNLECIDLSSSHLVTDAAIRKLTQKVQLKELQLFGLYGITDSSAVQISKCPGIETVVFGGCRNISGSFP